ncbi:MAG: cobalamin-dependent protein [Anaerolineaceae bacterium]|nr:cobalamin-dependent protein [Anaerolineaceae bacterium]MDD4041980.1 cobalamin-dependent protein [Anaerolineaceae bacterium]MDD4577445.1 cobalamin-dependent protein [Anaerolineaceae bacterium]
MNVDLTGVFKEFSTYLTDLDREKAASFCLNLLEQQRVTIPELYEFILAPSLNRIVVPRGKEDELIWREHAQTNIVRGIVERAYPYVLQQRQAFKSEGFPGKIILACPEEEYHELGIRMGADFYTITQFDVTFIGSNLPKSSIVSAVKELKPDFVAISVTNYLRLVQLNRIVESLRENFDPQVKIVVSGSAFNHTGSNAQDFGADELINSYEDVVTLARRSHEARA